jgi:hypothetical protein
MKQRRAPSIARPFWRWLTPSVRPTKPRPIETKSHGTRRPDYSPPNNMRPVPAPRPCDACASETVTGYAMAATSNKANIRIETSSDRSRRRPPRCRDSSAPRFIPGGKPTDTPNSHFVTHGGSWDWNDKPRSRDQPRPATPGPGRGAASAVGEGPACSRHRSHHAMARSRDGPAAPHRDPEKPSQRNSVVKLVASGESPT